MSIRTFGEHVIDMAEVVAITHVEDYLFQIYVRGVPGPFYYQHNADFAMKCNDMPHNVLETLRQKMREARQPRRLADDDDDRN